MGTSVECKLLSVVMRVGMLFYFCVHWLSPRSWVCRGQPTVRCGSWASQRCQGEQISVGAAAARPEAVHGEKMIYGHCYASVARRSREDSCCPAPRKKGLSPASSVCAVSAQALLFQALTVPVSSVWYSLQQSEGALLSEGPIQNLD